MRDLIVRVAVTDGDTASALRIISHFDTLVDAGAGIAVIVRAAAALADAPAGMHDAASGRTVRIGPDGATLVVASTSTDSDWPRAALQRFPGSSVWIEREGAWGPLDQLIVERAAQALATRVAHRTATLTPDQAVRLACDPDASEEERRRAIGVLGLADTVHIIFTESSWTEAKSAPLGSRVITLVDGDITDLPPVSLRRGIASAVTDDLPQALEKASIALELSVDASHGGPTHVTYEEVESLAAVATAIGPAAAAATAEVRTLEELRSRRPWVPQVLHQMLISESVRRAAEALHVHHSTLHDRLDWLEGGLGYSVIEGEGRLRGAWAWTMWRVSGLLQAP